MRPLQSILARKINLFQVFLPKTFGMMEFMELGLQHLIMVLMQLQLTISEKKITNVHHSSLIITGMEQRKVMDILKITSILRLNMQ